KGRFRHMMGATAGNQDAAILNNAHGPVVDFLVAANGTLEALLIFSKGRGVEDDGVVPAALGGSVAKVVKDVRLNALNIGKSVSADIGFSKTNIRCRDIHRLDALTNIGDLKRKPARVGASIQSFTPGIPASGSMVFPLIEERPGFLSGAKR